MLEKGKKIRIKSEDEVYTVMAAWNLNLLQQTIHHADYGYEVESNKGVVRIVVDTQIEEVK